jgi:hypothetical protein
MMADFEHCCCFQILDASKIVLQVNVAETFACEEVSWLKIHLDSFLAVLK